MPKFAANLTMLFGEQPFLDRFAAAKAAGFSGVEYLFPYDFDKAELREQLHQHGLTQVLHNLPAGNWAAGERGIAILPDRVEEFRDGVARAIDYAKALDCRQLNCLVGIAPDGADSDRSERGAGRQSALRRGCARQGRDQAPDRADQHDRYSRLLPEQDRTGASAHCGRTLEQSVRAVRHLPHADHGGRHCAHPAKTPGRASPMSSLPTIPAATSRAPARSTIPSCSAISTLLVIVAGSGANTSRGRRRSKASVGTPR